jgi:hypothetical protein
MIVRILSVLGLGAGIFIAIASVQPKPLVTGIFLIAMLALALWKPDLATISVVFALWGNVATIAVRFHHVPAILPARVSWCSAFHCFITSLFGVNQCA